MANRWSDMRIEKDMENARSKYHKRVQSQKLENKILTDTQCQLKKLSGFESPIVHSINEDGTSLKIGKGQIIKVPSIQQINE